MTARSRTAAPLRFLRRLAVVALAALVFTVVGIQFARIVGENIAMARTLSQVDQDVATLRERRAAQQRELRRLSDPEGAVPEIHDRLHLVRPNEAIIYLKAGKPSPQ